MILELIADSIASIFVTYSTMRFYQVSRTKKKYISDGTIPWSWDGKDGSNCGFLCAKCLEIGSNRKQMPYCSCEEYHSGHFHFKCAECGYTTIMRTADDK